MLLSGINTPTGVTPSVSGEDGSAFTASRDRADGDVQSAHTPRHPFSFAALPSHLGTGADSTADHNVPALGAPVSDMEAGDTPKEKQLKIEPTEGFHGCGQRPVVLCMVYCLVTCMPASPKHCSPDNHHSSFNATPAAPQPCSWAVRKACALHPTAICAVSGA